MSEENVGIQKMVFHSVSYDTFMLMPSNNLISNLSSGLRASRNAAILHCYQVMLNNNCNQV